MMNIREYFNSLYNATITEEEWDKVSQYEEEVYELSQGDEETAFEEWANKHNVDLLSMGQDNTLVVTYWCWDMSND